MNREDQVMTVLRLSGQPMSVMEVTGALGEEGSRSRERNRAVLDRLVVQGLVEKTDRNGRKVYSAACARPEGGSPADPALLERFAVEIPRLGHDGVTDPDVLDEIEAEKVWTCAAVLRAANTAWGIDMGIDADVREARALMAEARRQVLERAPVGEHYFEGEPSAPVEIGAGTP